MGREPGVLMDTPGGSAALAVVRFETAGFLLRGPEGAGARTPPPRSLGVRVRAPVGGRGDCLLRTTQIRDSKEKEAGEAPVRAARFPGGGWRAELTRARRGQSEAHNGTFPPGASCRSAGERGPVAGGAAALHGRERQDFKTFPRQTQRSKGSPLPHLGAGAAGRAPGAWLSHPRTGMNK